MIVLAVYIGLFSISALLVRAMRSKRKGFAARKTVTFGDESAITPDRVASVISILVIFLIWGAFTGSKLVPVHMPGPFTGEMRFSYGVTDDAGQQGTAHITIKVGDKTNGQPGAPTDDADPDQMTRDDLATTEPGRTVLVRPTENDPAAANPGYRVSSVQGQQITPGQTVSVPGGKVMLTGRGALSVRPDSGWLIEPTWLPSPEAVVARFFQIANDGYQNTPLWQHLGLSLMRVIGGFLAGAAIGIPLGYAMGLSGWFRGWFDPIVEFMRPVPPLALIPLVIIWFGIGETGKIVLLFLASLWIMTIAARSGVSGIRLSKIHAAFSLGASRRQILHHVIIPNSLPDIFTGARMAMGVCWGTVVAAELVAAQAGAGMMIISASKFQMTDVVVMGIIMIGIIGYGIDMLMRQAECWLVPWKGRG
ncbi:ABC transporter permease subunit [Paracoccus sp. N5]|uniref:ABC transporter permease n=1 Tax=Paracoccus sp. N5 TaxID=1101189 RepID=UPI00036226DB|nr:ABC transporter permease subunit [Paracoccus sp. N5]